MSSRPGLATAIRWLLTPEPAYCAKLRSESGGSTEDSGLNGEVDSWGLGPDSTAVHLGPKLKNQPEDSVLTPLAVEGFVLYAG